MSTMTKTTIITWAPNQIDIAPEVLQPFADCCTAEIQRLITAGKTSGQGSIDNLSDGSREVRRQWVDQESAQAWLDFVLSTVKEIFGPEKCYQSGVIEDIV